MHSYKAKELLSRISNGKFYCEEALVEEAQIILDDTEIIEKLCECLQELIGFIDGMEHFGITPEGIVMPNLTKARSVLREAANA